MPPSPNYELGCGHSVQYATRADHIIVDACGECPFLIPGRPELCRHPEACDKRCDPPRPRAVISLGSPRSFHPRDPAPDWCPLRKAPTIIAGPSLT